MTLSLAALFCSCEKDRAEDSQTVNQVVGDISFVAKFGHSPTSSTDEDIRIKTHLAYVENLLQRRDISHLEPALRAKRKQLLDLLHDYRAKGAFPRNFDHKGKRVPCFIDVKGNICAVGYLIEQTTGRGLAESINRKYKYASILEMNDQAIEDWISQSGLTREECAMIQPAYNWGGSVPVDQPADYNYISPKYAIASSVVGGINISMSAVNAIQISKGANTPAVGVLSLWSGAGSIFLGAINMPNGEQARVNESKKILSMVNIGLGTTTLILGICNLSSNRPKKEKSVNWNIYSFPEPGRKAGVAISLTKRL